MKHELHALFRVLGPVAIAAFVFAIVGRILLTVQVNNPETNAALVSVIVIFYMFAILWLVIAAYGLGISRFYKTLFTGEGYMTLSLPATPVQIIWAKLLSAIIGIFFAGIVAILSFITLFLGWDAAVMQEFADFFYTLFTVIGELIESQPVQFVEFILIAIVNLPLWLLVCYAVISIGQCFTARRKGVTYLIAIALYMGASIFYALVFTPFMMNLQLQYDSVTVAHITNAINFALCLLIDIVCFLIVRYILRNKVNLIA